MQTLIVLARAFALTPLLLSFFVLLSSDLRAQETWTISVSPTSQNLWGVCFGGGQYVAVGEGGSIVTSMDGTTWTTRASGSSRWLTSVCYGNGLYVAVGDQATILTSSDGVTWTLRNNVGTRINAVAFGNGMFIGADEEGGFWMSNDGLKWSSRSRVIYDGFAGYVKLRGLGYSAPRFVVSGANGTIGTTFDGTDYTSTTSDTPTTSFLEGIAYGQKRWVAVGAASVTGTSSDAVNWRMQAPSVGYLRSVIFFNNQFLAVGDNGTIRTSFDGGTWNLRASGTNQLLTSVAGNQTAAVAVGFGGSILRSVAARSAPAIAVQPTDITEAVGGNVAFSVSARGSEPLSYQWLKGGLPIIGAVSDTLFLPTITNASAGNYSCVITNPVSQITSSNANLSVDPSYPQNQAVDANFSADPLVKGANFAAIQSDGKILVTQVPLFLNQNQAQSGLARLSAAGTLDPTFKPGRIDGVTHATVQTDGRIVISGSFSNVNGVSRPYLARLNSDGSLDSAFNAAHNGSHSGAVTVAPDGKILFKRANSFSDITRLMADGSLDASWLYAPVTVGSNYGTDAKGNVYAFDVQPDGKVIVLFLASTSTDQDGSRVRSFVRRLNVDGTLDATFAGSFSNRRQGYGGDSSAVVKVLPDGRIMVSDTSSIRRLTPAGALDSTYRVQSGSLTVVAFGSDGRSWVGGMFNNWGGTPRNQLLRLNADGSQDETYSSGAGIQWRMWGRGTGYYLAPIPPSSIIPLQNGSALIGGSFTVVDTTETNGLIKTTVQSTNGANRPIIVAVDSAYREVPVGTSYSTAISASGSPPLSGGGTLSAVAQTSGPVKYTVRNGIGSSAEQWGYVRVIPSAPEFTDALTVTQPNPGSVITLSVMVRGSNPMTYRFFKDGKILSPPPGESSGSFSLNPRSVADSGSYVVVVENSLGSITSAPLILSFSVPTITVQPIPQITFVGQTVTLAVAASGYPAPAFVWKKNGVNVQSGASTTYTIPSVTAADSGSYTVDVVNSLGTVVSSVASVTVGPASFLSSLSVRSSLAANQTLILGAVIRGGNKSVLVRAAGPALNDFQLSGMEDPRLEFYTTSSAPLAANDDWPISLAPVSASVGAFPFINGSKDAALNQTLSGSFTVHGKGTGPGVILLEVYDVSGGLTGRLISLSARNRVGTGADSLIAGFAIAGTGTRNLLIRAAGPALAAFGVPGTLADPKIQIFDSSGKVVAENDDWAPALAGTFTNLGAFAFPPNSKDTALAVTLNAGTTYTVQVTGADGGVGEALVEIYEAP